MRKLFLITILISVSCLCAVTTVFAAANSPQSIPFDGRNWVVGSHDANDLQTTTEYVPEGQKIESWTELVTVSEFMGIQDKATPETLMTSILQMAEESCTGVKKNIIKTSKTDLIFEWETGGCKAGIPGGETPEFDISRIIFAKDRVFMMQYASRTALSANQRDQWIKIISLTVFGGTDEYQKFQKESEDPSLAPK